MRSLNAQQRQVLVDSARSFEDAATALKKRYRRLAAHDIMPRYVRALLDTAQRALDEAAVALVGWADGNVDEDGADTMDAADTVDLACEQGEDFGN